MAWSEPASLVDAFRECAAEHGSSVAVRGPDRVMTFHELDAASDRVAAALRRSGARVESVIGLCLPRSAALLGNLLGILKCGAAALLLDPAWPAPRRQQVLDAFRPLRTLTATGQPSEETHTTPPFAPVRPAGDNLAYVVCTSGSTGRPKAVGVTHRSVLHCVATHRASHDITGSSVSAWLTSPGSSAGVGEIWPALLAGGQVVAGPDALFESAQALRDWVVQQRVSHLFAPTPVARLLFRLSWPADGALRTVSVGGEQMPTWPPAALPYTVTIDYGSAEANGVTSGLARPGEHLSNHHVPERYAAGVPPIGYAWPDVQLYVVDAQLRPVGPGQRGELAVDSPELCRGYLGDARETARRFVPNPFGRNGSRLFRTGDLVDRDEHGAVWFHGRVDDVVVVRGHNVALPEVEAAVSRALDVQRLAVVPVESNSQVHLVCLVAGEPVDPAAAWAALVTALPAYMVPSGYQQVDEIPLLPNRKVDRRAAAALVRPVPAAVPATRPAAGDGDVRAVVLELWRDALDGRDCDPDTEFFVAGGTSLSLLNLIAAIEARLRIRLRMPEVLRHPTAHQLADLVESRRPFAVHSGQSWRNA